MSDFQDALEQDLADTFFDLDEWADSAVYNSTSPPIVVVITYREDLVEGERGMMALATIHIQRSDVSDPKYGDIVEIDGVEWTVVRELQKGRHVVSVEARSDTRGTFK